MQPLVRVGRSFRGKVSLPDAANSSLPFESHFHFWPPDTERAAARATLLGEAQAVAARLHLPALVLEGRPDRCAMDEPPLAVSVWRYASGGNDTSGGGAAELSLPLLSHGRAWCLTVRANGSATATLSWNLAKAAGSPLAAVTAGSATTGGGISTLTLGATSTIPGTRSAVPETTSVLPVSSQAGSTVTPIASSGATTVASAGSAGQIAFVLQVPFLSHALNAARCLNFPTLLSDCFVNPR